MKNRNQVTSPYRIDLLPRVLMYQWRSRTKPVLRPGELVFYGPLPEQYGIGEVRHVIGPFACVDFRGTGFSCLHEDVIDSRYLIPISEPERSLL